MTDTDNETESEEELFDFDYEYDHTSEILDDLKEFCKDHGASDLFVFTTKNDFFEFMQYEPPEEEDEAINMVSK